MSSHAHQLNCVKGEIHKMLSAMRLNQRWASSARFKREVPLESERDELKAFKTLAQYVETFSDLRDIDASRYLEPFLRTIRSKRASGAITGVALGSVNKFLLYGFISSDSIGARTAINSVARAICGCRFEATDPDADEVVLMKLLELMAHCLRSAAGPLIAPQGVWLMGLTCFKLAQLRRASALLRQTARNTLMDVIFTVFSSGVSAGAEHAPSVAPAAGLAAPTPAAPTPVAASVSKSGSAAVTQDSPKGNSWGDALEERDAAATESNSTLTQASVAAACSANTADTASAVGKPGSNRSVPRSEQAPLLERLTRFLVSLVNPRLDAALVVEPPPGWTNGVGVWSSCASAAPTADVDSEDGDLDGEDTNDIDLAVPDGDDPDAKLRQIVLGLTLINVVLETAGETLTSHSQIVALLQSDLCKFLLQNSQTDSLEVLSLTLRVVFNLFNSMKNHLKVQLEVFFTSVHLRIASTPISTLRSAEQKELALESLLEFCREPALMLDLYVNYDTDVHCTNLFETLLQALARNTSPESCLNQRAGAPLNSLNVLALEGLLAIISSISRRCVFESELVAASSPSHARGRRNSRQYTRAGSCADSQDRAGSSEGDFGSESETGVAAQPPRLERAGSLSSAPARSTADRPRAISADIMGSPLSLRAAEAAALAPASPLSLHSMPVSGSGISGSDSDADLALGVSAGAGDTEDLQWLAAARERTAEALQRRKRVKQRMHLAAERFNSPKSKIRKTWVKHAQELGLLPNPADAAAVARFLRHTPGLDRAIMGDYLAEEPKENPFNAEVLKAYVDLFDFVGLTIDAALRKFLERFRLPGEAQKIDRLMEAFAGRLFEQNKDMPHSPFADADAAFVLTFALIMLHTDLHNDSIPEEKKMTVKQFFRNCEGINAGGNLPQPYLEALYGRIKVEEIHMMQDIATSSDAATTAGNWDGVMARTADVAGATFTLQADNVLTVGLRAGIHEREMFSLMNETSIGAAVTGASSTPGGMPPGGGGGDRSTTIFSALCLVFDASQDDTVVRRCIEGFEDYARIAAYYEMTEVLNYLCISLCRYFRHFALVHIARANDNEHDDEQHASPDAEDGEHHEQSKTEPLDTSVVNENTDSGRENSQSTSTDMVVSGDAAKAAVPDNNSVIETQCDPEKMIDSPQVQGAGRWTPRTACGRATLLLHTVFGIASRYGEGLREGWRNVLECVLLLNQLQALPTMLPPAANMIVASDDTGGPLPLETFCDPLRSASGAVARRTPPLAPLQTPIARAARLGYMRCVQISARTDVNGSVPTTVETSSSVSAQYRRELGELVQHLPEELRPPESVIGSVSNGAGSGGSSGGGVFGGISSWFSSAVTSEATLGNARNRREAAAANLSQAASEAPLITPFVTQSRTLSEGALCEMLKAILLARDPVASKNASGFGFGQLSSAGLGMSRTREDAASLSSAAWLQGDPLQSQRDGVFALELACRVLHANSSAARAAVVWPLIAAYIERVLGHAHERATAWATSRLRQRDDTRLQQAEEVQSSRAGTTVTLSSSAAEAVAADAEASVHATNDADPERFDFLVERTVHSLLRCIGRLFVGRTEMRAGLLGGRRGLILLDKLDGTPLAAALAPMRAAGLLWLLQNGIAYLDEGAQPTDSTGAPSSAPSPESSESSWDALTNALATAARHEGGRAAVWAAVRFLLDGGLVTPCNVQHVRSLLLLFVGEDGAGAAAATFTHSPRWSRYAGHTAWRPGAGAGTAYASPADAVYALKQIVTPALEASFHAASKASPAKVAVASYPMPPSSPAACWLELMYLLGHRLLRARDRTVARAAWGALAEILAMPTVSVESGDWAQCFEGLLFPLALAARESAPMVAGSATVQSASAASQGGHAASGSSTIKHPHGLEPLESSTAASAHGIGGFESADAFYLRVATLVSRTFLHNVGTLASLRNFQVLWLRLVRLMALDIDTRSTQVKTQSSTLRYDGGYDGDEGDSEDEQTSARVSRSRSESASDRTAGTASTGTRRAMGDDGLREVLRETSIQALKNIVMVMHADGVFERVSQQSGQDLWALTATVLDFACPQLKIDIDDAVRAGTDCAPETETKGREEPDFAEEARVQAEAQAHVAAEAEAEAAAEEKRRAELQAAEEARVQAEAQARAVAAADAEAEAEKKRRAELEAAEQVRVQAEAHMFAAKDASETKRPTEQESAQDLPTLADGRAPHVESVIEERISGLVRVTVSGSLGITLRAAELTKDNPAESGISANVLVEHVGDASPLQGKVNAGDGIVCIAGHECGGASLDGVVQLLRDTGGTGPREIVFECVAPVLHPAKPKAPPLVTGVGTAAVPKHLGGEGALGTIGASPRPGPSRVTPDPGQTLRAATVARARSAAPKPREAAVPSRSMNPPVMPAHKIVATEHEFVEQTVSGALGLNLDTGTPGCATVTGVTEGSPFVGLVRAGAQIIAVDGIDCCDKGLNAVVQILRSTAGKPRVIRLSQRRLPAKPVVLPAMPPV